MIFGLSVTILISYHSMYYKQAIQASQLPEKNLKQSNQEF